MKTTTPQSQWYYTLVVLCTLLLNSFLATGQVIIDHQTFGGNMLPAGWTATNVVPATGYASFTGVNASLTTPSFNLSAYNSVSLTYELANLGPENGGPLTVSVSSDGGQTWTAQTFTSATPAGTTFTLNGPTAITALGSAVKINFTRLGGTGPLKFREFKLQGIYQPSLLVSASALTEDSLNNGTIVAELTTGQYVSSLTTTAFTLTGAPAGTFVASVVRNSDVKATLTLGYNNTDFDANQNIGVSVAASQILQSLPVTSANTVPVTANVETLAATPMLRYGLSYYTGGGPSVAKSFILSAPNLAQGSGTLTVVGNAHYEVSVTGPATGFATTATINFNNNILSAYTFYVRLKGGLAEGNYLNEAIAVTGGKASLSVVVNGKVIGNATNDICANAETLGADGNTTAGTLSGATYTTLAGGDGNADVWYRFNAPCVGTYTINLSGYSGNPSLFLFSGACPSNVSGVLASAQTIGSSENISYAVTQAGVYFIRVSAENAEALNNFNIALTRVAEVPYVGNLSLTNVSVDGVFAQGWPAIACGTTAYGVEYSTVSGFTPGTGTQVVGGVLTGGGYGLQLNSLAGDTTYYIRAWEQNATGTGYGPEQVFTTLQPVLGSYAVQAPVALDPQNATATGFDSRWFKDGEHSFVVNVSTSPTFDTDVFTEDFTGFSGSAEVTTPDTYFAQPGWTAVATYEANGKALVGSTGQNGYIETPAVDLSAGGDTFLSFDVQKFENQNTVVQVFYSVNGSDNWIQLGADIGLLTDASAFSFSVAGGTATSKFRIQSAASAPGKRFYIDNISVKSFGGITQYIDYTTAQATAQAAVLNSVNGYNYTKNQSGLINGTAYYYRIRAEKNGIYSQPSNIITASTLTLNIQNARLYVKKNSNGSGESWASPMGEVAEALQYAKTLNAAAYGTVKEIWVAGGKYRPFYTADTNSNANPDDRNNAFVLQNGVSLYGGFNGSETSLTARTNMPDAGNGLESVLTGKIGADSDADNAYHIVIATDITDSQTVVDGFIIRDGRATGTGSTTVNGIPVPQNNGAGIYNYNSNYKLKNILLQYNIADGDGGGVYNTQIFGELSFSNIEISTNQAANGAGVANTEASPFFTDAKIKSNTATQYGGGVYNSYSAAIFKDVAVSSNTAQKGAGIYNQVSTSTVFTNVKVNNNAAAVYGGGLFIESDTAMGYKGADVFTNAIFLTNTAGDKGGAIYYNNAEGTVANEGPVFTNGTFYGNTADVQANFLYYEYDATQFTPIEFRNSIIINPQTGSFIAGNASSGIDQMVFKKTLTNQLNLGTNYNTGNNLIATEPQFTDAAGGDFTLQPASSAINNGSSEFYNAGILPNLYNITYDFAGNDRVYDGIIDIGAYEWQGYQPCTYQTTWNGTTWSDGEPAGTEYSAVIEGNYTTQSNLTVCSLYVNSGTFTIAQGHTVTVKNEVEVAQNGGLSVQHNAALVQINPQHNTGVAHVYRNTNPLFRLDYTLWSAPVTGQTLQAFSPATSTNRFYEYAFDFNGTDWDEGYWPVNPSSTYFSAAKGYLIRMPNSINSVSGYSTGDTAVTFNGDFAGTPNNGNISIPLATQGKRFAAVGNPYPSPLNISAFFAANNNVIQNGSALYFWRKRNNGDNGSYATITLSGFVANPAVGGGADQAQYFTGPSSSWMLSPGQGFLVQSSSSASNPVLLFNNTMRRGAVANGQAFLKQTAAPVSRLWLNLNAQSGIGAQMAVAYQQEGTLGIDYGYDGKLLNESSTLKLYTMVQNLPLAIQARPEFDVTDVVPVGYSAPVAGQYSIALDHVDGVFANGQKIYLKDNVTGAVTEMADNEYTFTTAAGTFEGRFEIHYLATNALATDAPVFNAESVIVYQNSGVVNISAAGQLINSVVVYDMRGRQLYARAGIDAEEASINNLNAAHQVLIVEVVTEKGKAVKRIIF